MLEQATLTQTKYITMMGGVIGWLLQSVALVKLLNYAFSINQTLVIFKSFLLHDDVFLLSCTLLK